jgi:hypothetical protein
VKKAARATAKIEINSFFMSLYGLIIVFSGNLIL